MTTPFDRLIIATIQTKILEQVAFILRTLQARRGGGTLRRVFVCLIPFETIWGNGRGAYKD